MHTFEYFRHTIPGNYNLHIFKFLNIFGYSIYRCAVRHDEKNNLLLFKQLKETMIFFSLQSMYEQIGDDVIFALFS